MIEMFQNKELSFLIDSLINFENYFLQGKV
jgi:hypothetical protein